MKKIPSTILMFTFSLSLVLGQSATNRQSQQPEAAPDEVIRISTTLVQTAVVVTDKNDQVIPDLKLEDFEIYENGKKQNVRYLEYVSVDSGRRSEGEVPPGLPRGTEIPRDVTGEELKRVVAFVVDDLTIPFADMAVVRETLKDFVDNKMKEGDLVAIVRVVGGKGLLQQFTSDRFVLHRAIASLNVSSHPFLQFNNPAAERFESNPGASVLGGLDTEISFEDLGASNVNDPNDESQRLFRGLMSLSTADFLIESLKELPGRKSLVLISGGIPIFEIGSTGSSYSNVSYMLSQLADHAVRAGVVINTLDPRGLKATPGVTGFASTPARSALTGEDLTFGRGGGTDETFGPALAGAAEHLGLATVAQATGGISVVNTNNFKGGLDRVLARSSYYSLAYTPVDKFDNKFRKIEVKVKRPGAKVHTHRGYVAREERSARTPASKEEAIAAAAKSPLAKRELDISANVTIRPGANKAAMSAVGIHMWIDAKKLSFKQASNGKYQAEFDVVGFIYDQLGKLRGGFSETINTNLSPENYKEALEDGLVYSADTELPTGYFQIRTAVRESSTGHLGTIARYLEIPNLANGRLAMSSLFIFAANPAQPKEAPVPLLANRQLSSKQDLRYAAQIFNAKAIDNKVQLRTQVVISQGNKILYREPEQPLETASGPALTKIGQVGLGKVSPGRYTLTLIVTDPLADKKYRVVARSIDFSVE